MSDAVTLTQNTVEIPVHIINALTPKRLELIILPTEKCNLRCTYCYEDFSIGRIAPDAVLGIKNLLSTRAPSLHQLDLGWFGGEPLMAYRDIIDICTHAKTLAAENPHMHYASQMTTNGVLLTLSRAYELEDVGVRHYQISLDGPRELHDKTRITIKQEGTYDTIWTNLLALSRTKLNFNITLRVHYQLASWEGLFPLLDDINAAFGHDRRFNVFLKAITPLGGKNDGDIQKITRDMDQQIQAKLYGHLVNKPAPSSGVSVCYAAQANSLVIRADGAIGKCTVALNSDSNRVGKINADGTLTIDRQKFMPWLQGIETLNEAELSCPLGSHMYKVK